MDDKPLPPGEDPMDIPAFLRNQSDSKVPIMSNSVESASVDTEPKAKPAKAKAAPEKPAKKAAKAADKPKVKAKGEAKAKADKPAKAAKAKPKAEAKEKKSKAEKDQFGLRKGSSKSEAAAMYARKSGATLEEVKEKVGSIQLNVLNELEEEGFEVRKEKQERKGKRPVTRYWLSPKK